MELVLVLCRPIKSIRIVPAHIYLHHNAVTVNNILGGYMSQRIRGFWLKLITMCTTLYFMPLANFVRHIFGGVMTGEAYAGTIKCGSQSSVECDGVASKTLSEGQSVICKCSTDSNKLIDHTCEVSLECVDSGCWDTYPVYYFVSGSCYALSYCTSGEKRSCTSGNGTGTQTCSSSGYWGACVISQCKSGYVMVNGQCFSECNIANGYGYEIDYSESSSSSSS